LDRLERKGRGSWMAERGVEDEDDCSVGGVGVGGLGMGVGWGVGWFGGLVVWRDIAGILYWWACGGERGRGGGIVREGGGEREID